MRHAPLSADQIDQLVQWRHALHRAPEVSGQEKLTAQTVSDALRATRPDRLMSGLGGHGVAAIYRGAHDGPRVMIRCELDALRILERGDVPYASMRDGIAHVCGHDGHMAIVLGVAQWVAAHRPRCGEIVLLFQPAEEDGSGARAVIADHRFAQIVPNYAFALHNMPSLPLGAVALDAGPMACPSRGMRAVFTGRAAHASTPHTGLSPAQAMAQVMQALGQFECGTAPQDSTFRRVTLTHAQLGAPTFGVAPAQGELWMTLRTQHDDAMQGLVQEVEAFLADKARAYGLQIEITFEDVFAACRNDEAATDLLQAAVTQCGALQVSGALPMRVSEDFGEFGAVAQAAMLLLGAGEGHPALHDQYYDFPDALIPIGIDILTRAIQAAGCKCD